MDDITVANHGGPTPLDQSVVARGWVYAAGSPKKEAPEVKAGLASDLDLSSYFPQPFQPATTPTPTFTRSSRGWVRSPAGSERATRCGRVVA